MDAVFEEIIKYYFTEEGKTARAKQLRKKRIPPTMKDLLDSLNYYDKYDIV